MVRRPHNLNEIEEALKENTEELKKTNENLKNLVKSNKRSSKTHDLFIATIVIFTVSQLLLRVYEMFESYAWVNLITLLIILFLIVAGLAVGQEAVFRSLGLRE